MQHRYSLEQLDRDQLINSNLEVVKRVAYYYAARVKGVIEVEDLLQLGMIGLIEAAQKYTSKEGIPFAAYARLRIKGAIVDYLRKSSNLCRGTIKRKQDYERAKQKIEKQLNRRPTSKEISTELHVDELTLASWEKDFAAAHSQSIEEAMEQYGDFLFSIEQGVEDKIYNDQLENLLLQKLDMLNAQQLMVLQLYYVEELNVYEIAEILTITTGRVSQIKSAAIQKLRNEIEKETR